MTIPYTPNDIKALRSELLCYGVKIDAQKTWKLLRTVGDRGLCVDAVLMKPRPEWLEAIIGAIEPVPTTS